MDRLAAACATFILLHPFLPAQLAGIRSINPALPPSSINYPSLSSAVSALNAQGVSGPVVFEIYDDAGPYLESVQFYAPSPSPLSTNLNIGDGFAVLMLGQWNGVSATNPVTFRAAVGEAPVLDANGHAAVIYWNGADWTSVEGLELRGASQDGVCLYTAGTQNALSNTITRCVIHHCGRVGILVYGNSGATNDTLISNNVLHDLMTNPSGGAFSGFIRDGYIAGRRDNNTRILHNTFVCNTMVLPDGWIVGNYPAGTTNTAFTEVRGNVFVKSVQNGYVFRYQTVLFTAPTCSTNPPTMPAISDKNCFWNTGGGSFALVGAVPSTACPAYAPATYANLASWQAGVSRDLGSISANPLLTGPGTTAYHLAPGSPCVGLAGVIPGVTVDIDRQLRDAAPDTGADELNGAPLASVAVVGTGCPGSGGLIPALTTLQLPSLGNLGFSMTVSSALPNAPVSFFVAVGLESIPIPLGGGCFLYLNVQSFLAFLSSGVNPIGPLITNPAGVAILPLPVPNLPFLIGQVLDFQAGIGDPASPIGFTVTNALHCILY